MIKKIAHVGIATDSIAVVTEFYKQLGLEVDSYEVKKSQGVRIAMMKVGESAIELLEATDPESPVARFLKKRGAGIHHISLLVDDLEETVTRLREKGVQFVSRKPEKGVEGRMVIFVHPDSTGGVLVELCQAREEDEREMGKL